MRFGIPPSCDCTFYLIGDESKRRGRGAMPKRIALYDAKCVRRVFRRKPLFAGAANQWVGEIAASGKHDFVLTDASHMQNIGVFTAKTSGGWGPGDTEQSI